MSDHLERVTAYLRAVESYGDDEEGNVIASEANRDGGPDDPGYLPLTRDDLRALVVDAQQLRAQGTEYGIRADFTDTTSAEFTVADNLDDALEALAEFDAKHGHRVVSRELVQRPVGDWRKVGGEHV